jgi:hypothetical protein
VSTPTIDPNGVYFLEDLSRILQVSRRTLERLRAHHALPVRELPALDKRPRFSGQAVLDYLHNRRSLLRRAG